MMQRQIVLMAALFCTSALSFSAQASEEAELRAACERGVACFSNLACKPTISKEALPSLEVAKCYLDDKCKETLDPLKMLVLQKVKQEFPPNDTNSDFYSRMAKSREDDLRGPAGQDSSPKTETAKKK
jgi:hypothetical protein